jgi:hypothetical protein
LRCHRSSFNVATAANLAGGVKLINAKAEESVRDGALEKSDRRIFYRRALRRLYAAMSAVLGVICGTLAKCRPA